MLSGGIARSASERSAFEYLLNGPHNGDFFSFSPEFLPQNYNASYYTYRIPRLFGVASPLSTSTRLARTPTAGCLSLTQTQWGIGLHAKPSGAILGTTAHIGQSVSGAGYGNSGFFVFAATIRLDMNNQNGDFFTLYESIGGSDNFQIYYDFLGRIYINENIVSANSYSTYTANVPGIRDGAPHTIVIYGEPSNNSVLGLRAWFDGAPIASWYTPNYTVAAPAFTPTRYEWLDPTTGTGNAGSSAQTVFGGFMATYASPDEAMRVAELLSKSFHKVVLPDRVRRYTPIMMVSSVGASGPIGDIALLPPLASANGEVRATGYGDIPGIRISAPLAYVAASGNVVAMGALPPVRISPALGASTATSSGHASGSPIWQVIVSAPSAKASAFINLHLPAGELEIDFVSSPHRCAVISGPVSAMRSEGHVSCECLSGRIEVSVI